MNQFQKEILRQLVQKYENSKSFQGVNKTKQSFKVSLVKLFPRYANDAEYDLFCSINESVRELEKQKFVQVKSGRNGVLQDVILDPAALAGIYSALGMESKHNRNQWLIEIWNQTEETIQLSIQQSKESDMSAISCYIDTQRARLKENKSVEFFDGSKAEYQNFLKAATHILQNQSECYIRDMSVSIFNDSKMLESLSDKLKSFFYQYGHCPDRNFALEEQGVLKMPTYVYLKGNGAINIGGQLLDLSQLKGDIALSTVSLQEVNNIHVYGRRVLTIENLTSFHTYANSDDFIVYLGGFHSRSKRMLLQLLYRGQPDKQYLHFGDIDAGGFYIFYHLLEKTGIPFGMYGMDISTLERHSELWRQLTVNDRSRLKRLVEGINDLPMLSDNDEMVRDTVGFMLEHNCKLEQEGVQVLYPGMTS